MLLYTAVLIGALFLAPTMQTYACPWQYDCKCSASAVSCSAERYSMKTNDVRKILRSLDAYVEKMEFKLASIPSLPDAIFEKFFRLKSLMLFQCDIYTIQNQAFQNLGDLTDLSLSGNHLSVFSFGILNLTPNLQLLDLRNNSILQLQNPNGIYFPELRELLLHENNINSIGSDTLKFFPNLENLVLRKNPLRYIYNDTFQGLNKLLKLDLSHTRLSGVSDGTFLKVPSLVSLNLEHSLRFMHTTASVGFFGLDNLRQLILMNNSISDSSYTFHNKVLGKLQYLDLSSNSITSVDDNGFKNLENLRTLKLSYMSPKMYSISPQAFSDLKSLEFLDLQGNNLTEVPLAAIQPIRSTKVALAYGNHFVCNCDLMKFKSQIDTGVLKSDITCQINTETLFLSQMTLEELGCAAPTLNEGKNSTTITAVEGSTATILCIATSTLNHPQVHFHVTEGKPIPEDKREILARDTMEVLKDGRKLFTSLKKITVRKVEMRNSGFVTCTASNRYGTSKARIRLEVVNGSSTSNWVIGVVTSLSVVLAIIIVIAVAITCKRRRLENGEGARQSTPVRETRADESHTEARRYSAVSEISDEPAVIFEATV